MVGEVTVYDELDKFEGSGGGFNITWLNNPVAANGDFSSVGVFFLGVCLAHESCAICLFSYFHKYIFIPNDMECFSPCNTLFLGAFFACTNDLEDTPNFISVRFFRNLLVFGMVTELAVFKGLTCFSVWD